MTFLFVYFAMLLITAYFTKILADRNLLHSTYKLFIWSMLAEFSSLLLLTIALGKYGSTGVRIHGLEVLANLIGAAGILVFILMIVLLGKGFTVTRGTLSKTSFMKLATFMTMYTITYCILYIYEETMFDPRDVLYKYESVAGYGLIGLFFIGFLWTYYAIFFSIKNYPEKVSFYVPFGFIFALWWLATPVTIFICNHALDAWVRAKVVNGMERAVTCGGHIFFLLLTRPNAANRNFPFHIKTTQIGTISGGDGGDAHNATAAYTVRRDSSQAVNLSFTDLFVTDKTPKEKKAVIKVCARISLISVMIISRSAVTCCMYFENLPPGS
ncbi:transmembrane protein 145-like [Ptychodera flava]|uniref:transmembrane protein 145-like n=1 Tax=Ptychodera flava TaxID=63121 RepID=UPI00396A4C53